MQIRKFVLHARIYEFREEFTFRSNPEHQHFTTNLKVLREHIFIILNQATQYVTSMRNSIKMSIKVSGIERKFFGFLRATSSFQHPQASRVC